MWTGSERTRLNRFKDFKPCSLCVFWGLVPILSGFLSLALEPHHPLIAIFEGMSAHALFLTLAKESRL